MWAFFVATPPLHWLAQITEALEQLDTFAGLRRPSQTPDVQEMILSKLLCVTSYRLTYGEIQMLQVLNQRTERQEGW